VNLLEPADGGDFLLSAGPKRFVHQAMETIVKFAFLTAAVDVEFHDMWMTSDTWDELICLHFNLMNDLLIHWKRFTQGIRVEKQLLPY
jgi:hypothetical protein